MIFYFHLAAIWAAIALLTILTLFNHGENMATRAELNDALDKLSTRTINVLEDLKKKVAEGTATEDDFDVEIAKIQALTADVDADDPDTTNNDDATETPTEPAA